MSERERGEGGGREGETQRRRKKEVSVEEKRLEKLTFTTHSLGVSVLTLNLRMTVV